jgi:hypothetical protein
MSLYISPLIEQLPTAGRPEAACVNCPKSLRFKNNELQCFCTVMHLVTYGRKEAPITNCDGREIALAEFQRALSG